MLIRLFPFGSTLDETFRSGRSTWLKVGGSAFATTFVVAFALWRNGLQAKNAIPMSRQTYFAVLGGSAVLGAVLGLALTLKDVVRGRMDRGDRVNFPLRLFFGMGHWSLFAWFGALLALAFLITMATL